MKLLRFSLCCVCRCYDVQQVAPGGNGIKDFARITFDPAVMGGRPCFRGLRVTVGMAVGLVAVGHTTPEILKAYPYLEADDIQEALAYAAWRVEERDLPLVGA